jgi:hypothetical protein
MFGLPEKADHRRDAENAEAAQRKSTERETRAK